ncbi:MAG: ribosome maturation factor RimP [Clostridia bacterium]|nr:ribosome maturation factor RimP [Clostridia bacterium]
MNFKSVEEITSFLTPYADSLGIEIVEIETKINPPTLTIYGDTESGIDLDTLEKFHNLINLPLDDFDVYGGNYTLNVSSPGLDRAFKTARDYERNIGKDIEIKFYAPLKKGVKIIEATLLGYNGEEVTVLYNEKEEIFALSKIAKINKAIKFD